MKKFFLGAIALMLSATTLFAQDAPAMKQPNERAKELLLKMQAEISVTNEQGGKLYDPIFAYFDARQKAIDEMRASGSMDREAMRVKFEELTKQRNDKMAAILSAEQMEKFKAMEEKMRAEQRRPRGN